MAIFCALKLCVSNKISSRPSRSHTERITEKKWSQIPNIFFQFYVSLFVSSLYLYRSFFVWCSAFSFIAMSVLMENGAIIYMFEHISHVIFCLFILVDLIHRRALAQCSCNQIVKIYKSIPYRNASASLIAKMFFILCVCVWNRKYALHMHNIVIQVNACRRWLVVVSPIVD